ncbi:DUF732 domain-containing protein [Roseofilum sp. BLCC_M154]|uniref:DUF732 domain-containing protein n=1 Tax=Roseofilum acuticapitatum BLCC-M154 TaxID=3022444 RepID=A0ABT7AZQ7_9CYAN|nr:DUF732 domain-containing protein [Roseofilum acuticapitatum]MDJ1172355.1 DUF732 domain-containing protein [Roseofilum acuticapitatum BLCC-M154]
MSLISKLSWIGLTPLLLNLISPVSAQLPIPQSPGFEDFLPTLLTPLEAQTYQAIGEKKAIALAQQTCSALNSGQTLEEQINTVAQQLVADGITTEQAQAIGLFSGKVIAAAVVTLCPQHITQLQELELPTP